MTLNKIEVAELVDLIFKMDKHQRQRTITYLKAFDEEVTE
jgi:hypothetical protein